MIIGILGGTGKMGSGLGMAWAKAGHTVLLGSRTPQQAALVAEQIHQSVPDAQVRGVSLQEAAQAQDVVLLAVSFTAAAEVVRQYAQFLQNKLIIDITNPFGKLPAGQTSAAEQTAQLIGAGARVVAAFKTNFASTLPNPVNRQGTVSDCFICGDDSQAKQQVSTLVKDVGFRTIDCGNLEACRILDLMVPLMIQLDQKYEGGQHTASWKLLS